MARRNGATQILVTGAAGQLGSALMTELNEQGEIGLTQNRPYLGKTHEALDITKFDEVKKQLKLLQPDVVIHAAGVSSWRAARSDPQRAWEIVVTGTDNLVKACAWLGIPVIVVSCHSVFGGSYRNKPFTETDPICPSHGLAHAFAAAEHCVFRLGQCASAGVWDAGWRYWVIRSGPLFSPPSDRTWQCDLTTQSIESGRTYGSADITLSDDTKISPTYAPHLAQKLIWIAQHKRSLPSGLYHMANAGITTPYEFAVYLRHRLNWDGPLLKPGAQRDIAASSGDSANTVCNSTPLATEKLEFMSPITLPHWHQACGEFAKVGFAA